MLCEQLHEHVMHAALLCWVKRLSLHLCHCVSTVMLSGPPATGHHKYLFSCTLSCPTHLLCAYLL